MFKNHMQYFDMRSLRFLKNWRLLSFRKILFLPHILSKKEQWWLGGLIFVVGASGLGLVGRFYFHITKPVPGRGGALTEGVLEQPRNINPIYAVNEGDRDLSRLIFSGLLVYDGNGKVGTDLADRYEISPNGKLYTVWLRKDAQWHDGKNVTADDVIFTIKTIQNPQYKSPLRANWLGVNTEKVDDYTVRFSLRTPYAPFIENLSIGIIPKHLWEKTPPDQALLHELNLKPVGSGPYVFDTYKHDSAGNITSFRVSRNSNYYRDGPYLKTITFLFFKTDDEMLVAWNRGLIESFGPVPVVKLNELNTSKTRVITFAMPRIFGVFFNPKKNPLLDDPIMRKAIAYAIDKKEIASHVTFGGATPIDSIFPPSSLGYTTDVTTFTFDPEKSKALLDQAGWKDRNGDGIREKAAKGKQPAEELHFTLETSDWPDLVSAAEMIKKSLEGVGIDVSVDIRPFSELDTLIIRPRNFDMLLFGQVYGYEPDPFAFWHSSQIKDPGLNVALYANKKVDKLLEEARKTSDPDIRAQKYLQLQKLITADVPAVFLYSQLYRYALPTSIHTPPMSTISLPTDRFNEINQWYQSISRVLK